MGRRCQRRRVSGLRAALHEHVLTEDTAVLTGAPRQATVRQADGVLVVSSGHIANMARLANCSPRAQQAERARAWGAGRRCLCAGGLDPVDGYGAEDHNKGRKRPNRSGDRDWRTV
jgi:hypothetical protein